MVIDMNQRADGMSIPADIENLDDYERHAALVMPAASWRHIQEGCGRGQALAANRAAFDIYRLLPRWLAQVGEGSTAIELLGERYATPIFLAPVAYQHLAHPEGELATVRAATALGVSTVLSTLSSVPMEDVATASRGVASELGCAQSPLWFQLYFQESRDQSLSLIRRAEAAGYRAIMITIDASMKRGGFQLPPGIEAANLKGMTKAPQQSGPQGAILFGTPLLNMAPTWADIAWLQQQTRLPLIVKGILAPEDACLAIEHGADAIVVSNHGGRVMDDAPAALDLLPLVNEAIDGAVPLLIDGSIRSGSDIAKALALGASAVLIGRPQLHALAVAGLPGVAHMLHILRAELELVMAQLGSSSPHDLKPDQLFRTV